MVNFKNRLFTTTQSCHRENRERPTRIAPPAIRKLRLSAGVMSPNPMVETVVTTK